MRKKLFAILMSAMMMVTFMPAMAFAAVDPYTEVEFTGTNFEQLVATYHAADGTTETATVDTVRDFITKEGYVQVYVDANTVDEYFVDHKTFSDNAENGIKTELKKYVKKKTNKYIFDLAGATLYGGDHPLPSELSYAKLGEYVNFNTDTDKPEFAGTPGLVFAVPEYANYVNGSKKTSASATKSQLQKNLNDGWTFAFVVTGVTKGVYDAQTCTVSASLTKPGYVDSNYVVRNNSASKTIAVGAGAKTIADVAFVYDGVTSGTLLTNGLSLDRTGLQYDGAEHTIAVTPVDGVTVTYEKYNATTGLWDAVSGITYKDVEPATAVYRVTAKAGTVKNVATVSVSVVTAKVKVVFGDIKIFEGDQLDPYAFVKFAYNGSSTTSDEAVATAKAVKADAEVLNAWIKANLDATVAGTTPETCLVKAKKMTAVEWYNAQAALKNYTVCNASALTGNGVVSGAVTVNPSNKDNDLDFIGNATKKFHVKKAKALKKAKSFTVTAEALSGVAPTFKKLSGNSKITVAADGKVTVKKGLKKGTYKVKVKAAVAVGKGYKYASTTKTYTVKIVK